MNPRRSFLQSAAGVVSGAMAGAGLSACATPGAAEPASQVSYLFIHGAWHTSQCWNDVLARLTANGKRVHAIDLPGAGLNAQFPRAWLTQDLDALKTEVSPLKGMRLQVYVDAVVAQIRAMARYGKVVLVGHSFGGATATRAAEMVPELIHRVVYVTAFANVALPGIAAYTELPENRRGQAGATQIGDPGVTGAVRINNRSPDPVYVEKARQAFYNDVPTERFLPFAATLVPDVPLQAFVDDARGTAARWGRLPRSYIRCTLDQAIPVELQDRIIAEADASTPDNKFDQHTLVSSHSPFASMPGELATILNAFA
jgi:pimeloyl-ACP methyl ester carboxylesterase